jgi:hypothetical protein
VLLKPRRKDKPAVSANVLYVRAGGFNTFATICPRPQDCSLIIPVPELTNRAWIKRRTIKALRNLFKANGMLYSTNSVGEVSFFVTAPCQDVHNTYR